MSVSEKGIQDVLIPFVNAVVKCPNCNEKVELRAVPTGESKGNTGWVMECTRCSRDMWIKWVGDGPTKANAFVTDGRE